jgi:hypothetical protein
MFNKILKRLGLPTLALAGLMMFVGAPKANAAVRFGIGIGVPYAYSYPNPYYAYPYAYPYAYGYYGYPYYGGAMAVGVAAGADITDGAMGMVVAVTADSAVPGSVEVVTSTEVAALDSVVLAAVCAVVVVAAAKAGFPTGSAWSGRPPRAGRSL